MQRINRKLSRDRTGEELLKSYFGGAQIILGSQKESDNFLNALKAFNKSSCKEPGVYVTFGMKEYESPLSGKLVTSKHERREEMKRFGVREVDPSETGRWKQNKGEQ
jgi:hypothetical protein